MKGLTDNRKYANEILDDVECYKLVLQGKLKTFPKRFWTKPWSLQSSALITRYLLEEILNYTRKDICEKVNTRTFIDNKLQGMIQTVFGKSIYSTISNAYPNEFQPWELSHTGRNYWKDPENIKKAVRWLVETKLDNNRDRVCKEYCQDLAVNNGISIASKIGAYTILDLAYPNEFKHWELNAYCRNYWQDKENVKKTIRELVHTKLNDNRDRICKEFSAKFLKDNRLSTLATYYKAYELLDLAYPNEFKPWELVQTSKNYWNNAKNVKEVLIWITNKEFNGDKLKASKGLTVDILVNNGLTTLLNRYGLKKLKEAVKIL